MKILMIATAVVALAGGSSAIAAETSTQVRVSTAGLNLGDSQDARVMLRRLDGAAVQACGASKFSVRDMQRSSRRSDCYKQAMSSALDMINAPVLSSLYRADLQVVASR